MNNTILFTEKQRFTQWWIMLVLFGPVLLMLYGLYQQLVCHIPFGKQQVSDGTLILISLSMLLLPASFFVFNLQTQITSEGIYVKFFPFHLKFREYKFSDLQKVYLRQYKPIVEYGGWGIRGFGSNRAFNVSGKIGLQLEFRDGKRILIGTRKEAEIQEVLNSLSKKDSQA